MRSSNTSKSSALILLQFECVGQVLVTSNEDEDATFTEVHTRQRVGTRRAHNA